MKHFLTICAICLTAFCQSQGVDDIEYFYKNDNDSTFKYFISVLNQFNPGDRYRNMFCEDAAERVGDYYRSKRDYLKAIGYYDSADSKYRNTLQFCGNAYYIDFIPRRYKVAQCYMELKQPKEALLTLTPHIFDQLRNEYFDSTMLEYYVEVLNSVCTKEEIRNELKSSVEQADYNVTYRWTKDSTQKFPRISCKVSFFGSEMELYGYETASEDDESGGVPNYAAKQVILERLQSMPIFKRLVN